MIRGLYTSALGMITHMSRMDVVTNNIANANTTAYKRDHVVSHAFTDRVINRINDPGVRMFNSWPIGRISPGVFVDDIFTSFTQGAFQQTDNPLDLALAGQGFFVVNVGEEELFTRDGAFTLGNNGLLMTMDGGRVQGAGGDIIIPPGEIVIDETGRIYSAGTYVDTLRLTTFTDLHSLRKLQDNFFRTTEGSEEIPFLGTVQQGFLESSNVNIVQEMMQMIILSRAYETNSRMVQIQDATLQHAVNDIARRQ